MRLFKPNRSLFVVITIAYIGLLFFLSSIPSDPCIHTPLAKRILHNFLHVPAYGGLAFLFLLTFNSFKRSESNFPHPFIFAGSLAFIFGVLDEFHQSFVPGRIVSLGDILLDAIGIILVLFIAKKYMWKFSAFQERKVGGDYAGQRGT